ncbi:MAG: 4Fe-4S binding protein [Desulfomonile tiedjei]|nr:4Fe-4S binding protein [Desulfomonile tiedjei]
MNDVYKDLAKKLDGLPHGFPATESGVEIKILQKIFSPEDAAMALNIRPMPETAVAIAERLGKPGAEMEAILDDMATKGQIGSARIKGKQVYMFAPFVVGIFEFQLDRLDKELADLMEEYASSLMPILGQVAPSLMRVVVPVNVQIDGQHQVHVYEDVRQILDKAKSFQVTECICRKEHAIQGQTCSYPSEVCLAFANSEGAFDNSPRGRVISKQEALDVVAKAEEAGLVHATYNVQSGQMFMCNCCPCCCGIMRGMKEFNAPHLMAKSNYTASIDADTCAACGVCADERCPMEAIVEDAGAYKVQAERCIGCGVCATTCPTESISLIRKPESQEEVPPKNIVDWYMQRSANRGITLAID